MLVGLLTAGVMLDCWSARLVTFGFTLLPVIALVVLLADNSRNTIYVAAALLGFGLGSEMDADAYLVSRAFGLRAFGALYGAIALAYGLSSAIGPAAVGAALSNGVPLSAIYLSCLAALAPALVLLLSLREKEFPYGFQTAARSVVTEE